MGSTAYCWLRKVSVAGGHAAQWGSPPVPHSCCLVPLGCCSTCHVSAIEPLVRARLALVLAERREVNELSERPGQTLAELSVIEKRCMGEGGERSVCANFLHPLQNQTAFADQLSNTHPSRGSIKLHTPQCSSAGLIFSCSDHISSTGIFCSSSNLQRSSQTVTTFQQHNSLGKNPALPSPNSMKAPNCHLQACFSTSSLTPHVSPGLPGSHQALGAASQPCAGRAGSKEAVSRETPLASSDLGRSPHLPCSMHNSLFLHD